MLPAERAARGGRKIGRYLITARLGRGGMGMVYRGYDEALERAVALKTLTLEGTLDEESRQRFAIEAKAAARLQHPNIVTVYELGEERGLPYIAMELLPGVDLDTLLRSGQPLLVEEALDIVAQVCRGLQYAHDHAIVHRDVKPSNIRLLEDGTAKIMDFGIAKLGGTGVTRTGMMVGTLHYMSPEQIQGRSLDGRSDVFSAGVILYELVVGRKPFTGEAPTEILYKICHAEPPPPDSPAMSEVPELRALLVRALGKDPAGRPTAAEMAETLVSFAGDRLRAMALPIPAEALEVVNTGRRLLREGQLEEGVRRLREVAEAHPRSLEARRVLRVATGEMWRRQHAPPPPAEDDFPELAVTLQTAPTQVAAGETREMAREADLPGTATRAAHAAEVARGGRQVLWIGAAIAAAALAGGVGLVAARRAPAPAPVPPPTLAPVTAPAPTLAAVAPLAEATPTPPPPPVASGRLAVRAPYAVDVLWKGKLLARAAPEAAYSLPAGRQPVTLSAPAHFLKVSQTVEVPPDGVATLVAPALGRVHIKANPDNCEVFIDGTFVDYPPILDRAIAAGRHTVSFRWADGSKSEYPIEVQAGAPAYVTGRKEGNR